MLQIILLKIGKENVLNALYVINYCKASGTHPMLYKTKAEIKETDDSNKMKQNKNITENKVKGEKRNRNVKKKPKKKNKTNNKVRGEKTNKNIVTKIKPVHVVPKKLKDSNNKGKSKETSGWGLKWEIKNDTQHLVNIFYYHFSITNNKFYFFNFLLLT